MNTKKQQHDEKLTQKPNPKKHKRDDDLMHDSDDSEDDNEPYIEQPSVGISINYFLTTNRKKIAKKSKLILISTFQTLKPITMESNCI